MSFTGKNPKFDFINTTPQSADPSNPQEGDIFYSDGTPRDEGLWIYQDGNWEQFSTGAVLSVLNNLTLTPQSSDPGSPAEGMIFRADGTSRAEGIWEYKDGAWCQITGLRYQEFFHRSPITVRAASTANVVLNNIFTGVAFGGVTLALNDLILIKDQTTASENGVYIVGASGPVLRHSSADTIAELNRCVVFVTDGTNHSTIYYQTATLTSLSDNQTWSTTPATWSFTVPSGVYELNILACAAGGGGGSGGPGGPNASGGGGGGGAGVSAQTFPSVKVSPGDIITLDIGKIATGGYNAGVAGGNTIITGITTPSKIILAGGAGGTKGATTVGASAGGVGGTTLNFSGELAALCPGGNGGIGYQGTNTSGTGTAITNYYFAMGGNNTAVGGAGSYNYFPGGGGGAGGNSSFGAGGNGGAGCKSAGGPVAVSGTDAVSYGGGGGGGGGGSTQFAPYVTQGRGGLGGSGYVKISWN